MKYVFLTFLLLTQLSGFAQQMEGEVSYEKVYRWTKIYSRLTFLSNEEKDRMKMTWGNDDEQKVNMVMLLKNDQSYYTYSETKTEGQTYSWGEREYSIYRDLGKEHRTDVIEMLGKTFIIDDSLHTPKWKVMNKIKEVAGYMCMMAVTEDTIKDQKITAWFADGLPISAGPEMYSGLPGMILELDINDGDVVTTATKVKLRPVTEEVVPPKKLKGRKITQAKYEELITAHIRDSIKAQHSPYWTMPF